MKATSIPSGYHWQSEIMAIIKVDKRTHIVISKETIRDFKEALKVEGSRTLTIGTDRALDMVNYFINDESEDCERVV